MENSTSPKSKITTIGVPTRDRPQALNKSLNSYISNMHLYGRSVPFTIIDNTEDFSGSQPTRHILSTLEKKLDTTIYIANRAKRYRYAKSLARHTQIPIEIISFALLGDPRCNASYGACRNALLLDTVGEKALQIDDDTICDVGEIKDRGDSLRLTSHFDANNFWFSDNRDALFEEVTFSNKDFLGLHELILGRPVHQAITARTDHNAPLELDRVNPSFVNPNNLQQGHIRVSHLGTVGDAGTHNRLSRFFYDEDTYERLLSSEENYAKWARSRHIIRSTRCLTISNGALCTTINIGLDNRWLLPPFMPVLRTEDLVFGKILSLCFPGTYRGFQPHVIKHIPAENRDPLPLWVRFGANNILILLMSSFSGWPSSPNPTVNLRRLGQFLEDLGAMESKRFVQLIKNTCRTAFSQMAAGIEQQLFERKDGPSTWKTDAKHCIETIKQTLLSNAYYLPHDLKGSQSEIVMLLQSLTKSFGSLLQHWPDLVQGALELKQQGIRVSQKLSPLQVVPTGGEKQIHNAAGMVTKN